MTKLHKIYLGIVGVLVFGVLYAAHAYNVAQVRAEYQQRVTDQVLAAKNQALADRDKAFNDFKAQMLQQIADIKTAKQATQVLQPIIVPSGGNAPQTVTKAELPPDLAKTLPGPPNANYTLLSDDQMIALGKREKSCQLTESGLTKCEADKLDLQAQIAELKKANVAWERAGAVGPWTVGFGVAKSNAGNGYTPVMVLDRRITSKWGIFAGAENKAVFAGISAHFGGK